MKLDRGGKYMMGKIYFYLLSSGCLDEELLSKITARFINLIYFWVINFAAGQGEFYLRLCEISSGANYFLGENNHPLAN
jgi:hypothetical protein